MTHVSTSAAASSKLYENAVIHTSLGDIHLKLFPNECPKTVENFCVHARNGYYNGHIFHRVIKAFMIQTGDPLGECFLHAVGELLLTPAPVWGLPVDSRAVYPV